MNKPEKLHSSISRARLIAYWIFTGLLIFECVYASTWCFNWLNKGYYDNLMKQIGFPAYFPNILGIAFLLAAPIFVLPRLPLLKEWAYFGIAMIYIGAITSHLYVADGVKNIFPPLMFLSITLGSWALRPPSRKFPGVPFNTE